MVLFCFLYLQITISGDIQFYILGRDGKMPYIRLNDLNMFYEEFGKGETVLFLHSHFSRGLLAFSGQILPFAGHYRCLYPDFRGHGRTMCENLEWNSRMIADDMANFLEALEIKSA